MRIVNDVKGPTIIHDDLLVMLRTQGPKLRLAVVDDQHHSTLLLPSDPDLLDALSEIIADRSGQLRTQRIVNETVEQRHARWSAIFDQTNYGTDEGGDRIDITALVTAMAALTRETLPAWQSMVFALVSTSGLSFPSGLSSDMRRALQSIVEDGYICREQGVV